jgi:tetratricopeptide (TPR) repeat protein
VYAVEPALAHYAAALEAAAELGLHADREPAVRALLLQRGRMRFRTGDDQGATADFEAALDAARRSGDRAIEMETLNELGFLALRSDLSGAVASHEAALEIARELGDTTAQTNALDRLAVIASHRLEFDRALELGERALEQARGTDDEAVVGRAMDSIKLAVWQLGDLARLEELTAGLETLWRRRGDLWYLQWTLLESAFAPLGAGSWEEAERRLGDALAINRRTRDPAAEALMGDALCWLHRSRGAYSQALSAGKSAVERAAETGFWHGWTAATLGGVLLDLGAPALAAEALEVGLAASERAGRPSEIVRCAGQLAWARLLLGAEDEATRLSARAHELLGRVTGGVFLFGAHAYAGVARVLLATGAPDRGVQLVRPVLEAAERSGWRELRALTELVLGLCHEAGNQSEQARIMLARAASSGIAAPALEAHLGLARLADEPGEHVAAAETIIERIAADLTDDVLRASLRARAPQ